MGAKENLGAAMFDMFGVGKAPEAAKETKAAPAAETKAAPAPAAEVKAAPAAETKPASAVTYLAPGSCMEGTLKCQGDLHCAGIFKGDIEADGKVTVCTNITGNITAKHLVITDCRLVGDVNVSGLVELGEKASLEGKIIAGELVCAGQVKGDLDIKGNITLKSHSAVEGNVVTGTMSMESGAMINGGLIMKCAMQGKK